MLLLLFFSFISGLVTIAAPCIWPLLPIILSTSATGGQRKPLGVTTGILTSFTLFTLTLSYFVSLFHFDPDLLRLFAVFVIGFLGIAMLIPSFMARLEVLVSTISSHFGSVGNSRLGFWGGFITGLSLGIVWAPCAGPILATIVTLAATQAVTIQLFLVTLSYAVGVGIPLFLFATLGNRLFTRSQRLSANTGRIQQGFGILMILMAMLIFTGYDRVLQTTLLDLFPSYSHFLTQFESSAVVTKQLNTLKGMKNQEQAKSPFSPAHDNYGQAPEFTGITQWLNTDKPLTLASLKGKVVLVDFWTYTCINCLRTLPHVTSWYNKYKGQGFVVIGVHTPEFAFEKKTENVANAIRQYGITYPVAQDNNYATWNTYNNAYWPAEYLIDGNGIIRRTHFGEGEYAESEHAIQTLLTEAGKTVDMGTVTVQDTTPHMQLTPETYVGASRMGDFTSPQSVINGAQPYTFPPILPDDSFAMSGTWNITEESAEASKESELELNFYAQHVYVVMTPKTGDDAIAVLLDGKPISTEQSGTDVKDGKVVIDTSNPAKAYHLVDLKNKPGRHILELRFVTPGASLFAFTFG